MITSVWAFQLTSRKHFALDAQVTEVAFYFINHCVWEPLKCGKHKSKVLPVDMQRDITLLHWIGKLNLTDLGNKIKVISFMFKRYKASLFCIRLENEKLLGKYKDGLSTSATRNYQEDWLFRLRLRNSDLSVSFIFIHYLAGQLDTLRNKTLMFQGCEVRHIQDIEGSLFRLLSR